MVANLLLSLACFQRRGRERLIRQTTTHLKFKFCRFSVGRGGLRGRYWITTLVQDFFPSTLRQFNREKGGGGRWGKKEEKREENTPELVPFSIDQKSQREQRGSFKRKRGKRGEDRRPGFCGLCIRGGRGKKQQEGRREGRTTGLL